MGKLIEAITQHWFFHRICCFCSLLALIPLSTFPRFFPLCFISASLWLKCSANFSMVFDWLPVRFASIPMMYPAAFIFQVPSNAFVFLVSANILFGVLGNLTTFMMKLINDSVRKYLLGLSRPSWGPSLFLKVDLVPSFWRNHLLTEVKEITQLLLEIPAKMLNLLWSKQQKPDRSNLILQVQL